MSRSPVPEWVMWLIIYWPIPVLIVGTGALYLLWIVGKFIARHWKP